MQAGVMVSGVPAEFDGQALTLDSYLGLIKAWGSDTLDIFPGLYANSSVPELKSLMDSHGLTCACYYIGVDLAVTEPDAVAAAMGVFETGIETALALGAPVVFTHGTQHSHAGDEKRALYIERLTQGLEMINATDLTLVIENAGTLLHTVDQCVWAMEQLADRGLRFCNDMGNFFLWAEDEIESAQRLAPWTVHAHIKDYTDQVWLEEGVRPDATHATVGTGQVRNSQALQILAEAGFDGVCALEPHNVNATQPGLAQTNQWLADL